MPGLQLEAGQPAHQVQLGRPDVALRAASEPGFATLAELEVVRHQVLAHRVVGVHADVPLLGREHQRVLPRREAAQFGNAQLDHEPAAGVQVPGRVAEALDLLVLGEQVPDRVEDQVDQRKAARSRGRRHVADDHREVRLLPQSAEHRLGQFDAGDGHSLRGQRDGDASGADGELEHPPAAGQRGEAVHSRVHDLGREHAAARGVVAFGGLDVPDVFLQHTSTLVGTPMVVQRLKLARFRAGI
ncbi:Uncharacterised protein [Amycolatopsis camponoti]|uniref:Uncharacterized protein n=1 Tax=Amycolatopsis camponoti TaxID=2606593 RepID=A0A6I8LGR8_9PSEU|nr:Uncharacterised protein [Amycolatopsis camponoti]